MKLREYVKYDGLGLAELVKTKQITPAELRETALKAVEVINPRINAVATMIPGDLDITTPHNVPKGPFEGVPFMLKDVPPMIAGVPANNGSRFLKGNTSEHHHNLMVRFREAGLVSIATTCVPEMSASGTTESVLYGNTLNPWNDKHSAGGSSGGSAAAVSGGLVPLAHGGDGGGSIRMPASCCGIIGMKPTRGRIPNGPDRGEAHSGMAMQFLLTRSIRDTAAILDAVNGPDIGAYAYVARPQVPFLEEIKNEPRKLKIAWTPSTDDEDVLKVLHETIRLLEELGHEVVEDFIEFSEEDKENYMSVRALSSPYLVLAIEGAAKALNRVPSEENLEPSTWANYQRAKELTAVEMAEAVTFQNKISRRVGHFFQKYDILLNPTIAQPPALIGEWNPNNRKNTFRGFGQHFPVTPMYNLTGLPAISLPLGWTDSGLPVGMQFGARFADEATLLQLSRQLEIARPWKDKRPAYLQTL
ncbi:MAG TPA: amidase [Firmicutes bacterium]|nr:amidase [Bacillota bacterium]